MRIISGSAGGLRLQAPGSIARPTSDRVREALFSILGDQVPGAHVLDLFAGSGALGLEALSRGAARVDFVDQDRRACQVIHRNLEHTKLAGPHVRVHAINVGRFLKTAVNAANGAAGHYDLAFADPPYVKNASDIDLAGDLLTSPALAHLLTADGVLVLETATNWAPPETSHWQLLDDRAYGGTRLWRWQRSTPG